MIATSQTNFLGYPRSKFLNNLVTDFPLNRSTNNYYYYFYYYYYYYYYFYYYYYSILFKHTVC